jgi:hypothetical protein
MDGSIFQLLLRNNTIHMTSLVRLDWDAKERPDLVIMISKGFHAMHTGETS